MFHLNWEQSWKEFAVVAFSKLFLQHFFSCVPWLHAFYKRPLRHTVSTRPNSYYAFQAAGMLIFIRFAGEKTFLYWYEEPTLGWQASYRQSRKHRNQRAIMEFMKFMLTIPEVVFTFYRWCLEYGKYTSDKAPKRVFAQVHHLHNDQQAASSREWWLEWMRAGQLLMLVSRRHLATLPTVMMVMTGRDVVRVMSVVTMMVSRYILRKELKITVRLDAKLNKKPVLLLWPTT